MSKRTSITLFTTLLGAVSACTPEITVEPTPVIVEASNCCCDAGGSSPDMFMGEEDMPDDQDMFMGEDMGEDMGEQDMPDDDMGSCSFTPPGPVTPKDCTADIDRIQIDPVVEWSWPFDESEEVGSVMMTPVVGNIDRSGPPDIVFAAYNQGNTIGKIVALKGDGTGELWSFTSVQDVFGHQYDVPRETTPNVVNPVTATGIALGDIDADGEPDVCFAGETAQAMVVCVNGKDGSFKWASAPGPMGSDYSWAYPAIANIDGQGEAEVVLADHIYKGGDGSLFAAPSTLRGIGTFANPALGQRLGAISVPVDLDGDGVQELVAGKTIYEYDGTQTLQVLYEDALPDGFPAVADLDLDSRPEIVRTAHTPNMGSQLVVVDWDANQGWHSEMMPLALPDTPARTFGGPPTIADFDASPNMAGVNYPEIAVAGSEFYQVYDVQVTVNDPATLDNSISLAYKWSPALSNRDATSSATGSAVFDFEGDGNAEVVYADQQQLFILDGATGSNRIVSTTAFDAMEHCSATVHEYPVIVDADGDEQTEIVLGSNHVRADGSQLYTSDCNENRDWRGIRVISSKKDDWVYSRKVWNQHAYSISNINDDLSVPLAPAANWLTWNNFRTADAADAPIKLRPDLEALGFQSCDCNEDTVTVAFSFGNASSQDINSPFTVGLHDANNNVVLYQQQVASLQSGGSMLVGPITLNAWQWMNASIEVRIDDTVVPGVSYGQVLECSERNNSLALGSWPCESM